MPGQGIGRAGRGIAVSICLTKSTTTPKKGGLLLTLKGSFISHRGHRGSRRPRQRRRIKRSNREPVNTPFQIPGLRDFLSLAEATESQSLLSRILDPG